MESPAEKARALAYALLVHVLAGLVMFVGLWWSRPMPAPNVRGSIIEAVLVTSAPASAPAARPREQAPRESAPPPQPQPSPQPQTAPTPPQPQAQTEPPRPDVVERERAARLALEQAKETARREEQERRRREQVLLEEQRRQEEAEQRQRLTEMQLEQQKQLEDIRRQRVEAERERKLAEEKLAQLADARRAQAAERPSEQPPAPVLGNQGTDESLLGRYVLAIQQAVERNWIRPETIQPGQPCEVRIVQIPGGEVISASVQPSCRYDDLGKRSVEAAVLRAQPLPYGGYESVFRREILFTFRAPEG